MVASNHDEVYEQYEQGREAGRRWYDSTKAWWEYPSFTRISGYGLWFGWPWRIWAVWKEFRVYAAKVSSRK